MTPDEKRGAAHVEQTKSAASGSLLSSAAWTSAQSVSNDSKVLKCASAAALPAAGTAETWDMSSS
jgi:hypothetical protein